MRPHPASIRDVLKLLKSWIIISIQGHISVNILFSVGPNVPVFETELLTGCNFGQYLYTVFGEEHS